MDNPLNDRTLDYYNQNALDFYRNSVYADMSAIRDRFLKVLPQNGSILDFGCGSGRDMKAFLDLGYDVDGIDGSEKLAKLAKVKTGKNIETVTFDKFKTDKRYDGIWACATLLHFPFDETLSYLNKLIQILKPGGIIYLSLKKGAGEKIEDGKYFKYYSEEEIKNLLDVLEMNLIDFWETEDSRAHKDNTWFNVILKSE